jgi:hypothetical protein
MSKRLVVLAVVALTACGVDPVTPVAPRTVEAPLTQCEVSVPPEVTGLLAMPDGVAFIRGDEVLLARGHGCALEVSAPVALGPLQAVDDLGRLYVMASEELRQAHFPEAFGDTVARVDPSGAVTPLVSAGRGIWTFSVSPRGETVAMTACGPQGVLALPSLEPVFPDFTGDLANTVLTGPSTAWSFAMNECVRGFCADRQLVRSTPEGSTPVAGVGSGTFSTRLARCGDGVCVYDHANVTVFAADGRGVQQLTVSDLGAGPDAVLEAVSANALGLYLTVLDTSRRVTFVPMGGHAR